MNAVSKDLLGAIHELQHLPAFSGCSLGGGTNLAIRYNHRVSLDIDLFLPGIIGKQGYESIKAEVIGCYGERAFGFDYPCDIDDQFLFLRFFVSKGDSVIKVEVLQNMHNNEEPEIKDGIRLMTERDISILKIMTACNRANQKDIYDLDYLTENFSLQEIMDLLVERQKNYNKPEHISIFDLDGEKSPIDDPTLLLKFERTDDESGFRPMHSNPRIESMPGKRNWLAARASWRKKVRAYFKDMGLNFP